MVLLLGVPAIDCMRVGLWFKGHVFFTPVRADVLQGVMPLSARHPSSVSVAIHHPHTPSTTVMEWFREGSVLSGAFREHGGVEVMACVIRTAA